MDGNDSEDIRGNISIMNTLSNSNPINNRNNTNTFTIMTTNNNYNDDNCNNHYNDESSIDNHKYIFNSNNINGKINIFISGSKSNAIKT